MTETRYLHHHKGFSDLLKRVSDNKGIEPSLVEKDYYIMHCLYGLQKQGFTFDLKGGTSLSKGYHIIHRFSEDIDICVYPDDHTIKFGRNHTKDSHNQSRKNFYDSLAKSINIDGIIDVKRDISFDDIPRYRSGGIRLYYEGCFSKIEGIKDGILLELGFDQTTPHEQITISSWAYDEAIKHVNCIDNRAIHVNCYHPAYTLVEKLQTISTKYRNHQETGIFSTNFMRHYYDVYCLLQNEDVRRFIGSEEYHHHKERRFPQADNKIISQNPAFNMSRDTLEDYKKQFEKIKPLFYQECPSFEDIMNCIQSFTNEL